uniref:Erythroid differentiation-related factor 1 n=1 Tax=Strigamia maritima TaxID=126957 RepID=T1JH47_STRMM
MEPLKDGESSESTDRIKDDPDEKNVKSTAIVKFAAVQAPAMYAELQSNTDLNLPPANWLRKVQCLGGYGTLDINTRNEFSSFHMANNFPDCIGEVDVVSAAENIKKLLKIPYSKAQVSMLIHRIGKTILVDEFDIHKHLLRTSEDDLQWLKKFYFEHVLQSLRLKEKAFPRKNKSRYHLQHKSMFSKFLYHSIADYTETSNYSEDSDSSLLINSQQFSEQIRINEEEEEEEQEDAQTLYGEHKFLRDVLWTFEDITMLIGTDMPIFGGGKRPCVSLRLRDKNKPINILTGLDYWLDNLMCNVPEIMMCYHLDGIVQQYELLKTEDIPKLNNNCNFSPKVIKDVAQNILSFLKSNATKTGHTYWLFKGKDDDVIKLYDLTTLCLDNMMEGQGQNPFAIHVAMLFYTLARNLHGQPDLSNKNRANMHFFLEKCIRMLEDAGTQPQVRHKLLIASAQFLLADLLVKGFAEDFSIEFVMEESNLNSHSSDESSDDNSSNQSPSVEVESLRKANRIRGDVNDNALVTRKLTDDPTERCLLALEHIFKGLDLINENPAGRGTPLYDEKIQSRLAKPFQAIPLKYSSLASSKSKKYSDKTQIKGRYNCGRGENKCWISLSHQPNCPQANVPWQVNYKLHLLEKGGIILCFLAERAFSLNHRGIALRYLQMIFMCLEGIEAISATCEGFKVDSSLLPNALGLTGDVHYMLAKFHQNETLYVEEFEHLPDGWEILSASIPKQDLCFTSYEPFWVIRKSVEEHLFVGTQCYEEALFYTENDEEIKRLKKRHGNALNDLGVMYMNNAKTLFEEKGLLTSKVRTLYKKSCDYLSAGVDTFKSIGDQTNVALLSSNLGHLMRLCAHSETSPNGERRKEFSTQERRYFQKVSMELKDKKKLLISRTFFFEQ